METVDGFWRFFFTEKEPMQNSLKMLQFGFL